MAPRSLCNTFSIHLPFLCITRKRGSLVFDSLGVGSNTFDRLNAFNGGVKREFATVPALHAGVSALAREAFS
jgi:hypothetical protein